MALNAGNIRVAGTGAIWYGPAGTALPTDSTTALNAAFKNVGFATDGFEVDNNVKTKEINVWQTAEVVKLINTSITRKVSFEGVESNKTTVALAWGAANIVAGTAGAYTLDIPAAQATAEFVIVLDWSDGTTSQRLVIPRAVLTALPKLKFGRQDEVKYAFDIQALAPFDNSDAILVYGVDTAVAS